jgi:pimeloyl-ACP methyl ester carboxylesterase
MPPAAFQTPVDWQSTEIKVRTMYLVTEKDRGIMLEVQEKIIAAVPGMQSIRLPCGHSPFLSHPDETVDVIVKGAALQ